MGSRWLLLLDLNSVSPFHPITHPLTHPLTLTPPSPSPSAQPNTDSPSTSLPPNSDNLPPIIRRSLPRRTDIHTSKNPLGVESITLLFVCCYYACWCCDWIGEFWGAWWWWWEWGSGGFEVCSGVDGVFLRSFILLLFLPIFPPSYSFFLHSCAL